MRREEQTPDTPLPGPFPSHTAWPGELPVQSVRPYAETVRTLQGYFSNERILSYLRRGVTRFAIPREQTSLHGSEMEKGNVVEIVPTREMKMLRCEVYWWCVSGASIRYSDKRRRFTRSVMEENLLEGFIRPHQTR